MSKKQTSKSQKKSQDKVPTHSKSGNGPDLVELEKLFKLMGQYQMGELEWENADQRVHISTHSSAGAVSYAMPQFSPNAHSAVSQPAAAPVVEAKAAIPSNLKQVLSPFVGTFYRSSSPGGDAYVKEGTVVKRGDVLCIVEAMKLMNEIESEFQGKIVSVLVENGQAVEFGEPLFAIEI